MATWDPAWWQSGTGMPIEAACADLFRTPVGADRDDYLELRFFVEVDGPQDEFMTGRRVAKPFDNAPPLVLGETHRLHADGQLRLGFGDSRGDFRGDRGVFLLFSHRWMIFEGRTRVRVFTISHECPQNETVASDRLGTSDAASQGTVTAKLIANRPVLRPAEILEFVPGVVITQHSGGGRVNRGQTTIIGIR
jgi:hypothetical protein